jgi:hypothetical protein
MNNVTSQRNLAVMWWAVKVTLLAAALPVFLVTTYIPAIRAHHELLLNTPFVIIGIGFWVALPKMFRNRPRGPKDT